MKKTIKGSIILALILLITGCTKDEWMNPVPITSVYDQFAFDTKARIEEQVNGIYSSLKSGQHLGGRFQIYNDVRCDNFLPRSSNLVTNFATWNHTVISSTNEVQNLWGAIYSTVNTVNLFLEGIEAAWSGGKLDGVITQAEYDQYRAEALAVRAICYFDLVQMYSKPYHMGNGANRGVPLRLTANKTREGNDMAPSTVAQVYDQILNDLNDAEPFAKADFSNTSLNITRVHRNTIIAYKTRVYLHMHDWDAVVTESAKIVPDAAPFTAKSGVAHALNASYMATFASPNVTKESIFSLPHTSSSNPGTQNFLAHYYQKGSSESYYLVTGPGSLYATMDATDVRKTSMETASSKVYIMKYTDRSTRTDWSPVIRWAEVLLNRSEALVRAGNAVTQEAVDLLNAVRTRSFATGAYTLASFATIDDFINAILLERNMEFLGEGIRNMDLMRTGLAIPSKSSPDFGTVGAILPTAQSYFWPVPDSELSYNKLMTP
ncbi:MAG TPA: RagB/SusD family nutrient uptake outer membrane protein [Bacteroidales bacterium]|nr:RagB/SusD family nutrient uptake outer membrane protein [Bacteroidales bacterium]